MAQIAKARKEQNSSYRINKDKLSTFIQYLNATCFKSLHSILNFVELQNFISTEENKKSSEILEFQSFALIYYLLSRCVRN